MARANTGYKYDLVFGHAGETLVDEVLGGKRKVEVKHQGEIGFDLMVETDCDYGRTGLYVPSGISISQADYYVFVVEHTGLFFGVPSPLLRTAIKDRWSRPFKCDKDGRNRSRGRVASMMTVMNIAEKLSKGEL